MFNIAMMDPDTYIKYGLSIYFNAQDIHVVAASNISDLTVNLYHNHVDVVVMELFSRDDDVFDCIEFIRVFPQQWPTSKLVIYTQIVNEEAIKLLIAVTGQKEIFFKTGRLQELAACVFTPWKENLTTPERRG